MAAEKPRIEPEPTPQGAPHEAPAKVPLGRGLSSKLLVLTAIFVLLAEILIFPPSAANFRQRWLEDKLATVAVAAIVLVKPESASLSDQTRSGILATTGARAIAVREGGATRLLATADMPPMVDEHVDLDAPFNPFVAMADMFDTLLFGGDRIVRVYGTVPGVDMVFEAIVPDTDLRDGLLVYSRNIALLSLLISLITATLVFYAINRVMIRPVRAMTRSMLNFAAAPDDPARVIDPEDRNDEIGVAERELAGMQKRLQGTLVEQKRLADLGLAVSKINHDMRNVLASAQLLSDRLAVVKDPSVQSFAPKLMRTIDRAVDYTRNVLDYGRAQEAPPVRRRLRLRRLADEVSELVGLDAAGGVEFVNAVADDFEIDADAEQLFRVMTNLCRNAVQAMAADGDASIVKRLTVDSAREGTVARIRISDTGPGLPKKARDNLFAAFKGSARSGGTGLGLAIAQELVRAHGGAIELVDSRGGNTVFQITIPDQPVDLDTARGKLRRQA